MADEIAVDSFLNLLGQSDLLPDDQLLSLIGSRSRRGHSGRRVQRSWPIRWSSGKILTAWQADMLLKGKNRGFRLGPYRILGLWAKGA